MITLCAMTDRDYAWLLGEQSRAGGLVQCEGSSVTAQVATTTGKLTALLPILHDHALILWAVGWNDAEPRPTP